MKIKIIACLILIGLLLSCKKEGTSTQEQDEKALQELASIIMEMTAVDCADASQWAYTAFGDKPCGGPAEYIAYPTSINTTHFLNLVKEHQQAAREYNQRWGLISDCMVVGSPKAVICENGKAVLEY